MAHARLRVGRYDAQRTHPFLRQNAGFVGRGRGSQHTEGWQAVDGRTVFILHNQIGITFSFDVFGDAGQRVVPRDAFPLVGKRFAHFRIMHAVRTVYEIQQ